MTDHCEADETIQDWLTLASNLADMAERLDTVERDHLSGNLTGLRAALSCVVPLFQASGGVSFTERAYLREIMNAKDPTLLPYDVIKEGLLEGAQQLWAMGSLLRMGEWQAPRRH